MNERPLVFVGLMVVASIASAAHPHAAEQITSLTNPAVKFTRPKEHYVVLKRGGITAVIVDNESLDVPECPGHRAGYNGVAVLKKGGGENLFVPPVAGLNFEHIHDGTSASVAAEKFEPRKAPMELRVIDEHTVELYQPPTPNMKLESCGRYTLLEDGAIEYTFECIPRGDTFTNDYIGLFWASYIQQPESTAIYFIGFDPRAAAGPRWKEVTSPAHGTDSTHPPAVKLPELKHDADFPLTLVYNRSKYVYSEPWYYGLSHGRAYVQMFRPRDRIWLAQSPNGGGNRNPAWDFQWFVPEPKLGEAYGFTMRAMLLATTDRDEIVKTTAAHRGHLGTSSQ
jgi:hypothetical protein